MPDFHAIVESESFVGNFSRRGRSAVRCLLLGSEGGGEITRVCRSGLSAHRRQWKGLVGCFCRHGHFWQGKLGVRCTTIAMFVDAFTVCVWSESGERELESLGLVPMGFNGLACCTTSCVSGQSTTCHHLLSMYVGPCSCGGSGGRAIRDGAVVGSTGLRHDLGGAGATGCYTLQYICVYVAGGVGIRVSVLGHVADARPLARAEVLCARWGIMMVML